MSRVIPPPSRILQIVALVAYTMALGLYLSYTASNDRVTYETKIDNNLLHVPNFNNTNATVTEVPHLVIEEVTFNKNTSLPVLQKAEVPKYVGRFQLKNPLPIRQYKKGKEPKPEIPVYPEGQTPADDQWQIVHGTNEHMWVYSAYYENRSKRGIRVIGALAVYSHETLQCIIWDDSDTAKELPQALLVDAEMMTLPHSDSTVSALVFCPLKTNWKVPRAVSVVADKDYVFNLLSVNTNLMEDVPTPLASIALCVSQTQDEPTNPMHLIEFVEMYRILGVSHFYFYTSTPAEQVDCLLNEYKEEGIATTLEWNSNHTISGDCIYRAMNKFGYVATVNLTEFVFPRNVSHTLPELILNLNANNTYDTFIFKNAYFYQSLSNVKSKNPITNNLLTQTTNKRLVRLDAFHDKELAVSKYIVQPKAVVHADHRGVQEYVTSGMRCYVNKCFGFTHHYRPACENGGNECQGLDVTTDTTSFRYRKALVKNVSKVYESLQKKCELKKFEE